MFRTGPLSNHVQVLKFVLPAGISLGLQQHFLLLTCLCAYTFSVVYGASDVL